MNEESMPEYKSGGVAGHLGMSSQGLFWYEKEHLISPSRESGQRAYSAGDAYVLSRIKFYRQLGISLTEIDAMLGMDIDEAAERLEAHAVNMRRAVEKEQAKIQILEERTRLMRCFRQRQNVFSLVEMEPFYFKLSFVRYSDRATAERWPMGKHWANDIPFTQTMTIMENVSEAEPVKTMTGFALPSRYLPYASVETREEIERGYVACVNPGQASYALMEAGAANDREIVNHLSAIMDEPLWGKTVLRRPLSSRRIGDDVVAYWEVWAFRQDDAL